MGAGERKSRVVRIGVIFGVFAIAASCGGEVSSSPPDDIGMTFPPDDYDGGYGDAGNDGALDGGITFDASPTVNADGWTSLAGFDPNCGIYSAPSPSAKNFPPPIAWQPCEARFFGADDAGPDGGLIACEEMADNFGGSEVDAGFTAFWATATAYVDRDSQRVLIPIEREIGDVGIAIVAEADGPVHQAFTVDPVAGYVCQLGIFGGISAQNVVYHVEEYISGTETALVSGALGGDIDEPIMTLRIEKTKDSELQQVAAGANIFADVDDDGIHFGAWADGHDVVAPYDAKPREVAFQGDDLFFSWFDGANPLPLLLTHSGAAPVSFLASAADLAVEEFGTDGVDMVWIESSGYQAPGVWTTNNIMTAPYTTDPTAVVKRRLRSDATSPPDRPFIVGCGFAARPESDLADGDILRIVRLSDGQSWKLATVPQSYDLPLAITCTEVFVNVAYLDSNVARIRLDSLGPGDPPD